MSKVVDCKCQCGSGKASMIEMKTTREDVNPDGYVHLRCIRCGAKTPWMQMNGPKWTQGLQESWDALQVKLAAQEKAASEAPKTERTVLVPTEVRLVTYEDYILRRVREGGLIVLKKEVIKTSIGKEIVQETRMPLSEARKFQNMAIMSLESVTRERLVTTTRKDMKREKRADRKEREPVDAS